MALSARFGTSLAVIALVMVVPVVAGTEEPANTRQTTDQCVNVAVSGAASALDVAVSLWGVIGFRVTSPKPGDGIGFGVYVVPDFCTGRVLPAPLPIPTSDPLKDYRILP